MPILPGRRLGPYEILSAIGAGGMGEVYRARDTRLDRIVAIKVLPTHLADRSELRERFEREAKTIASLNHPHICVLHDIGHQDGTDYLVMEYLEGETLAQRLCKGPLPLEQVLQYAIEIADSLDKAHRKGITHRDLKPGNIMITKSGTKLLDFGLAKLKQEVVPENIPLSDLPTAKDPLTAQGTLLGTLHYMAPEQVEGKEVDARTDIFAFGAIVYEMATGKRAFEGKSPASLIAKILEIDPPAISSLQPMSPAALDRVVKRCLAKDPDDRWQTARDLEVELSWIGEGESQVISPPIAESKGISFAGWRGLIVSVAALLLVATVTGYAVWNLKPSPSPQPVTRTLIGLPPGRQLAGLEGGPAVALSPDGTHIAYVGRQNGTQQVFLRALNGLEANPVPGTEGAVNPFFSPDGQWLGFFADRKLKKISVSGGAALTLGDAGQSRGASWGSQGMIAFASGDNIGLMQVSDAGGAAKQLTHIEEGEIRQRWPEYLLGGKAILFASGGGSATNFAQIVIHSLLNADRRVLVAGGTNPHYAPSGHLIYAQGGSLMAVPFDLRRLTSTGAAVPVVEGIMQSQTGGAQYTFSATGSLAYVPGAAQAAQFKLVWVSRTGIEQPLTTPAHTYQHPRLSPDGRRVALQIVEEESQVWTYDLARDTLTRFSFEGKSNGNPTWTADGKRISFYSTKDGPQNLYWQMADGSGGLERLTTSEHIQAPMSFSSDGQLLAFLDVDKTTGWDIWVLRLGDAPAVSGQVRKAQPFLRTTSFESAPRFSPDGRLLAYISDESGQYETYVQLYPGPGGKWQISTDGGTEPVWNPNGRELFYRSGDKMMAVDITTQPAFAAGKPRVLFQGPYVPTPLTFPNYDVSSDGQRFLMVKPIEQEAAPTQINIVLNWFEELKQKVPTGK